MNRIQILTSIMFLYCVQAVAFAWAAPDPPVSVKLRIEWGEQTPRLWNARFALTGGEFVSVSSLGVDADEAAVVSHVDGKVVYQPRASRVFNSMEFQIRGTLSTRLQVLMQDRNDPRIQVKHQFQLQEILEQKIILPVPPTGTQLVVQQAPGDSFALKIDRPHLVFAPGEQIQIQAFPKYLMTSGEAVGAELQWSLHRSRTRELIASGSKPVLPQGQNELLKLGVPLIVEAPAEGVYDLVVRMGDEHEAVAQFIVLSSETKQFDQSASHHEGQVLVDEIELEGIQNHHALVTRRPRQRIRNSFKSLFKAGANTGNPASLSPPWSAYHLKLNHRGRPHRLVISYPRRPQAHVGFSILEPDASGQLVPVGVDSGVYLSGTELVSSSETQSGEYQTEVLFWPKVDNPILLFHSLGTQVAPEVLQVQVYELPISEAGRKDSADSGRENKRLVGPYLQKPLLPEIFGASQALDQSSNRSLDDWQTFYEAGNRLAFYLKYHHFNSVLLSVSADGSAIYPSKYLSPTPRYDSGVYHSTGQDIQQKDVLELLYQIFDRERLTLMPELQFSSILAGLEQTIQDDSEQAVGVELVNQHGQTWRHSKGAPRGQAPYYNPLHPRVQDEIACIFEELVTRYSKHASFQGVAIQLSLNGYLQLPGLDWGYDDFTVSQFEKETGVKVPVASGVQKYEKRYQYLTTSAFPQWTQWRCQKIKGLHQRLAEILLKARPDAKIVFAARELLPSRSKAGDVISSLKAGGQIQPVLMEMGLDFSSYDQISNGVVLRPKQYYSAQEKMSAAHILNTHPTVDDAFKTRVNGTLYYHHPVEVRISEFDSLSPWQPAFTWLVSQASPVGISNRMRYVHSIAQQDPYLVFDGGWTIPFGQEQVTRSIRTQLQQLPARPFQTIQVAKQPVVARLSRGKNKTFYYLVNDFPYASQVTVELNVPSGKPVIHLASGSQVDTIKSAQGHVSHSVELAAFDFQAFEVQDSQVQIISVGSKVASQNLVRLQAMIDQKKRSLIKLHQSMNDATAVVLQAGFEGSQSRDYILAGWESKGQKPHSWNLDQTQSHSGKASLLLDRTAGNNSLKTNAIPLQDCRYLNMSVWMKTNSKDMQVRIALEAEQNGKLKVQSAIISVDQQWRKYLFRVKDIPSQQITNAHILIEKLGAEKLWIDDVDLQIHQISPEDDRQLTKLVSTLSFAWDSERYLDCYRLLNSYWGQFGSEPVLPQSVPDQDVEPLKHAERRGIRKLIRR
ncbi:family 10 glycosylhydrolase [Gimesia fumaroli]|uniref:Glycosyl hydrolase-like 10 domain-containing protein n=1 Tax=Gimesia fumaroli TaxID=2527976 RepID=A0A518IDA9_9PLAN|nr:family 10 glycosylhydrolase [Gimesia fumaroli]QDV51049.1 hypothetical protein Enr17x_31010 [Gimesia fumaroli]